MYSSNLYNCFHGLQVNLKDIEKLIRKDQAKIYLASQVCAKATVYESQKNFLSNRCIFLVIVKSVVKNIKEAISLSDLYCRKLLTASYFSLFAKLNNSLRKLAIVRSEVVNYSIFLLACPEWEAKYSSFIFTQKSCNSINCTVEQLKKIFNHSGTYANIHLLKLNLERCWNNYIAGKKFLKLFTKSHCSEYGINQSSNRQLREKIIYAGIEWCLYINSQAKFLYSSLHLVKSESLYLFTPCSLTFNMSMAYLSEFFSKIKANLKSLDCTVCRYVNENVCVSDLSYGFKNQLEQSLAPSKHCIKNLISSIKQELYHKNIYGDLRKSNHLNSKYAASKVVKTISLWSANYSSILSQQNMSQIERVVDCIFYKWQMK